MNKAKINLAIDTTMLVTFIIAAFTSITLFIGYRIPNQRVIHEYVGLAFIALMTLHIVLHLGWLSSMLKNLFK